MHSYDLQTVVFASVFSLHFFVLHIRSITSDSQHENDSNRLIVRLRKRLVFRIRRTLWFGIITNSNTFHIQVTSDLLGIASQTF